MSNLVEISKKLLMDGTVNLLIGYQTDKRNLIKPCFATTQEQSSNLIFYDDCKQNLVAYLHKPEITAFKKIGIILSINNLRAYLQLKAENQFKTITVIPIVIDANDKPEILFDIEQVEEYIKNNFKKSGQEEISKINQIMELDGNQRWNYWVNALQDCIKCYACRSACPMCYCEKCATDCNQPQWVPTSSHVMGNIDWHIMRAMHLGGRCVNCNECARACPMDIPLNLLTRKLNEEIESQFGQIPGLSVKTDYAFSSYKFEDKEHFIR